MLIIQNFQCGYELFTALCIVGDSGFVGLYVDSTPSCSYPCKNKSLCIVINDKWEEETDVFEGG